MQLAKDDLCQWTIIWLNCCRIWIGVYPFCASLNACFSCFSKYVFSFLLFLNGFYISFSGYGCCLSCGVSSSCFDVRILLFWIVAKGNFIGFFVLN